MNAVDFKTSFVLCIGLLFGITNVNAWYPSAYTYFNPYNPFLGVDNTPYYSYNYGLYNPYYSSDFFQYGCGIGGVPWNGSPNCGYNPSYYSSSYSYYPAVYPAAGLSFLVGFGVASLWAPWNWNNNNYYYPYYRNSWNNNHWNNQRWYNKHWNSQQWNNTYWRGSKQWNNPKWSNKNLNSKQWNNSKWSNKNLNSKQWNNPRKAVLKTNQSYYQSHIRKGGVRMEQQHFRTQHNATPYNRNPRFNQRDISHIQSHPINARMNYPVNRSREAGQLHIRSGGAGVMHGGGGFKNAGHGRGRH